MLSCGAQLTLPLPYVMIQPFVGTGSAVKQQPTNWWSWCVCWWSWCV